MGTAYSDYRGQQFSDLNEISHLEGQASLRIQDLAVLQEWYCQKVDLGIKNGIAINKLKCTVDDLDFELAGIAQANELNRR